MSIQQEHPADLFWKNSVERSASENWISVTVFKNLNSRRYAALRKFVHSWRSGKIQVLNVPENMTIFCPSEAEAGRVKRRRTGEPISLDGAFMYLAPQLEFDSQRDTNWTVAHEFAHVELGHHSVALPELRLVEGSFEHPAQDAAVEAAADDKAADWGFPKRKRGVRGFQQLVVLYHARTRQKRN